MPLGIGCGLVKYGTFDPEFESPQPPSAAYAAAPPSALNTVRREIGPSVASMFLIRILTSLEAQRTADPILTIDNDMR